MKTTIDHAELIRDIEYFKIKIRVKISLIVLSDFICYGHLSQSLFYAVLMPDLLVYFAHNALNNLLVFTQLFVNKNGEVYNSKKNIDNLIRE